MSDLYSQMRESISENNFNQFEILVEKAGYATYDEFVAIKARHNLMRKDIIRLDYVDPIVENRILRSSVEFVDWMEDRVSGSARYSANDFLETHIYEFENQSLKLLGHKGKSLSEVYVYPRVKIKGDEREEKLALYNYVKEWLRSKDLHHHLVVLGGGGIGKSSFMKFLSFKLSLDWQNAKEEEGTYYPILLSLNNILGKVGDGIAEYLVNEAVPNLGLSVEIFREFLSKGKIVFLLDAFDEMGANFPKTKKLSFFLEMKRLIADYKGNKVILSGRPSFFVSVGERQSVLDSKPREFVGSRMVPYFEEIEILPLTEQQVLEYFKLFFAEESEASENFKWLKRNDKLFELSRHPFYLTLISTTIGKLKLEEVDSGKEVKFRLLKEYVDEWITWQGVKNLKKGDGFFDEHENKTILHDLFVEIAVSFYSGSKMKNEDLKAKVYDPIRNRQNIESIIIEFLRSKEADFDPGSNKFKLFVNDILGSYFLQNSGEGYKFLHQTFMDYFVTDKLIQLFKSRDSKHYLFRHVEWSSEIVNMSKGLLKEHYGEVPTPELLYAKYPPAIAWLRDKLFRSVGVFFLVLTAPVCWVWGNAVVISFVILLTGLLFSFFVELGAAVFYIATAVSLLVTVSAMFVVTKKQNIWNWLFKIIAKESRSKFNFMAKAYKFSFETGSYDKENQFGLFKRLFSTYTIFPLINDVTFDKYTILKHNLVDVYFKNFTHSNGSFFVGNVYECHYENVDFVGSKYQMVTFNDSFFRNTDFSGMGYSDLMFKQVEILRKILNALGFLKKDKGGNPTTYLMDFPKAKEHHFDEFSLNSLRAFMKRNNLHFGKQIQGSEWLEEALRDGN